MTWAAWCGRSNLGTRNERSPRPVIATSSNWNGRRRSSSGSTSLRRRTCNPSQCCASIPKWSAVRLTACGVSGPRETPGRSSVRWIPCAVTGSGRTTPWTAWSTVSGPPQRSARSAMSSAQSTASTRNRRSFKLHDQGTRAPGDHAGSRGWLAWSLGPLVPWHRSKMIPMTNGKIRIIVAKPGLDGHDRGAKVVARALRDAGFEVIYTGLHQTPEMIANAAIQEDVDVVGLSVLSGAHMTLFPRVRALLAEQDRDDILITGGGIIPKEDMEELRRRGIGKLFGPGTPTSDLVEYIRGWFAEREKQEA